MPVESLCPAVSSESRIEPRPYQARIVSKTINMFLGRYRNGAGELEPPVRSVLVESPTGSGKTAIGHLIAKLLQQEFPDLAIGWVAMRRNLLSQAASENRQLGINVENIYYMSMFDKDPHALVQAKNEGRKVLIVVDEAQHDAASSMAHLHNIIEPDMAVGLSATPYRTDNRMLCFDKVVKDAGIHQLIQDGWLSQYDHYTIPKWDVPQLADFYCAEPELWGKSIFFFHSLDECFALDSLLRSRGIRSDVVTGSSDRDRQLAAFRRGETQVLINCMVLTEGFDDPTLQTVWVRPSAKGPTIQMAGRALRKCDGIATKQIVQCQQTPHPFTRTAMCRQQYLWQQGEWRSLKINPKLNLCSANVRRAIARTEVVLPKYLQRDEGRRRPRVVRF